MMKPTKNPTQPPDLLPGCDWAGTLARAGENHHAPGRRDRWWVRSSAQQKICPATGRPMGFRHVLMHGLKAVRSGVGADAARAFRAQAGFLNEQGLSMPGTAIPIKKGGDTKDT